MPGARPAGLAFFSRESSGGMVGGGTGGSDRIESGRTRIESMRAPGGMIRPSESRCTPSESCRIIGIAIPVVSRRIVLSIGTSPVSVRRGTISYAGRIDGQKS